jgi:long-subunit fatty acid transport protein
MYKLFSTAMAGFLASTAMSSAGGLERTNRSVGILFEQGTHAELSYSIVAPNISGMDPATLSTGNAANQYSLVSGGYKTDLGSKFSLAVIVDQPFGIDMEYGAGIYSGTSINMRSNAVTLLLGYDVTDRIVVFGGGVAQNTNLTAADPLAGAYTATMVGDIGYGYVLGAAYQIPDRDLRVALTYHSEIDTTHDTLEFGAISSTTNITTPQSVNLEFQAGLNVKTLLFGAVRWADWSKFNIRPANYPLGAFFNNNHDSITYTLGIERKVSDRLALEVALSYEKSYSFPPNAFTPYSGFVGIGIGATYDINDNTAISGRIGYQAFGDLTGAAGSFTNNHASSIGIKIAHRF